MLLSLLAGCGGAASRTSLSPDRVVITHTENLSGDSAFDGAARVISHLVRTQLARSKPLAVFEAAQESEAIQRRAGRIVRSWLDADASQLSLHVTVRSADGKTLDQWLISAPAAEGSMALAASMARRLSPSPAPPPAITAAAAARFGEALIAPPDTVVPILRQVVAQAGTWGDAYYLLGANLAAAGKTDEALRAWKDGLARSDDEVSKARMEIGIASVMKQPEAAVQANEKLAELLPAEPEIAMQAGALRLARSYFAKAAKLMEGAVKAEPAVGDWWNQLAFVQAFAGNEQAALESIRRYEQVAPGRGNPADSRGEIQFLMGQFQEAAASFLEAYAKEPNLLAGATIFKGAQARLMAGDAPGAAKEFERYASGPLKNHPLRELVRARWEVQIGKREEGIRRALALAREESTPPDVASASWSQLAWWSLIAGERPQSLDAAKTAIQKAQSMPAKREALFTFYLAQPSASVEEWKRRANGNPPADLLALTLVFDRKWKDALPVLADLVAKTHPFRAGHWRILYAWALIETGDVAKAREWLRWNPIPLSSGGEMIEPLVMAKAVELRKR